MKGISREVTVTGLKSSKRKSTIPKQRELRSSERAEMDKTFNGRRISDRSVLYACMIGLDQHVLYNVLVHVYCVWLDDMDNNSFQVV